MARLSRRGIPEEVAVINREIRAFLDTTDDNGRRIGSARCGVYAFYDYDDEPIYVGQTEERLRARIGRHLTNQRTDAVAMNVLDPFEVASIEVWPFFSLDGAPAEQIRQTLSAAEHTVYQKVLHESALGAVLNEKEILPTGPIPLPQSYRHRIIPDSIFQIRSHPDIRIARRASTIARLAQVISERDVSLGLRRTLLTQARRLERLARQRFDEFEATGETLPLEQPGEETGQNGA